MTHDEMKEKAIARIQEDNPDCKDFKASRTFENIMDATVISVAFKMPTGKEESNHAWFRGNEIRTYRWHSDILSAVSGTKERQWFFRLIQLAGVNGVIALVLILIFSALLGTLLLAHPETYQTILELVKVSFSVILGYLFGSQASGKKDA